ncbi:MAG: hypothetical protein WCH13_02160 [Deltaproteobacteria bacterium]
MSTNQSTGNEQEQVSKMKAGAQALAQLRRRPCLLLARAEIEPWDVRLLFDEIAPFANEKAIDVLLCSYGGSIDGAYRMVREIRRRFRSMTLFVPGFAKSAATLFALAADEIVMGSFGEFGPMDAVNTLAMSAPLGRDGSSLLPGIALEVIRANATGWVREAAQAVALVTGGTPEDTMGHAIELVARLSAPVLAQVAPGTLAESTRQTDLGRHYGARVVRYRHRVPRDLANGQIERLVVGYPSHGFVIDYEELLDMGLPVRAMEDAEFRILEELGRFILRPPMGCPDEIVIVPAPEGSGADLEDEDGDDEFAADAGETAAEDGAGDRNDGRAATDASEGARNAGAGGASSDEWRASSEESDEEANGGVAP